MQTATPPVSNLERNSVTTDVQVIFDDGSQRTCVNEALCKRLQFPVIRSERIIVKKLFVIKNFRQESSMLF